MTDLPWIRLRSSSLQTKLVVFSALLTALAVGIAFLALSLELRRHTRRLLAASLVQHQETLLEVEKRGLEELLRVSTLISESPTLRAAMETYRSERSSRTAPRRDLLATIRTETERIAAGVGRDLLVVTDDDGRVLAAAGRPGDRPATGENLSRWPLVAHALDQEAPVGPGNFSILRLRGQVYRSGCVPILLQGFVIGTLTVGDRVDQAFVERLQRSFGGDVVARAGATPLGTTLGAMPALPEIAAGPPSHPDAGGAAGLAPAGGPDVETVSAGGEEYVAAPMDLGTDADGRPVTLWLLRSLTRALASPYRALVLTLLGYGSLVVVVAGLCASLVARSVLSPLEGFVRFMSAAAEGRPVPAFDAADAGSEVRVLSDTFSGLLDSLRRHEEHRLQAARDEIVRVERLKESEKLAALGRLLSGAAHEINNPLTGVVGNIEMILTRETIEPALREKLETIRREGRRIVALVRNLLKVAHRDRGQRVTVDVNQVLRDTAALRRHDFERAGLRLVLDLSNGPLRLTVNELELQQVFLNIINNAFDALREVQGRPTLTIRTSETPQHAAIVFADNGPGLRDSSRVFEHFYTTKPVGQGTGLGLSISRAIVEGHGGRITAENAPGGGACFVVTLPRLGVPETAATAEPAPATDPLPAPQRSLPVSVLVVDDEPVVLELQLAILDSVGARAVGAKSGAEAIDILRRRDFDLIVSDLVMPGEVSGKALHAWVASHRRAGTRGFVFVTGDTVAEAAFLQEATVRCVLKPFSMEEYVSALREVWHGLPTAA